MKTLGCFGVVLGAVLLLAPRSSGQEKVHVIGKDGLNIKGELGPGKASETYRVKLIQGGTYVIDMISPNPKALDPFLRLLDATGKLLASDDYGGKGHWAAFILIGDPK